MSAGTAEGNLKTLASQRLGNVGIYSCAIYNYQAVYGLIPISVGEDVAHAAQVSFTFLAHVADENDIGFRLYPCLLQRRSHCQHGHHACGVVTDARPIKLVASFRETEPSPGRKDSINMRADANQRLTLLCIK